MNKLIDFHASWCGPCKMQRPIVDKLKIDLKDKIEIEEIDVDINSAIADQYNVKSIPTIVFVKDGKEVGRMTGLQSSANIIKKINELGL